jgi:hypothetical protein
MQITNLLTYLKELTLQKFTGIITIHFNEGGIRQVKREEIVK